MQRDVTMRADCSTTAPRTRPDRSELAELLRQTPLPDGFSLDWVFDRFDLQAGRGR